MIREPPIVCAEDVGAAPVAAQKEGVHSGAHDPSSTLLSCTVLVLRLGWDGEFFAQEKESPTKEEDGKGRVHQQIQDIHRLKGGPKSIVGVCEIGPQHPQFLPKMWVK